MAVHTKADSHESSPRVRSRSRVSSAEIAIYAVGAIVIAAVLLLAQRGAFVPDIKPEVYLNPWARLRLDLSTWLPDPYLGTQNYNLGLAPVDAFMALVQSLGVPAELSARLLRIGLYLLAGAGAFVLFRKLAPESDRPAARIAVVATYVLNPYSIVAGSTLAIMLPYAVFPWFLLALRSAVTSRGWRAPALTALAFAAMSGMNVGAVPILQMALVPVFIVWLLWLRHTDIATAIRGLFKCAVLSVALSLYWLIPAYYARETANAVVANSETLPAISNPSGWGEVLRGLGLWPMYGGSALSPWQPGFTVYLMSTLVIAATFVLIAFALAGAAYSRSPARVLGVGVLLTVGAVMVGLHPITASSPIGLAMRWGLENVPGLMAIRTTNKAGAGLALAIALLIGLLVGKVASARFTLPLRASTLVAITCVWLVACQPFWAGQAYVGRWDIPDYWRQAAADLNNPDLGRLWLVPGQVLAGYRWSTDSVDDVNLSLLDRRSTVVRTVLPTQSRETSNLLYNADQALQAYQLGPTTLSEYARLMGASQVLLRNDVRWNLGQGLPADLANRELSDAQGLTRIATYGNPGDNTHDPNNPFATGDTTLNPLVVYDVNNPQNPVRASPFSATTVIAGDAAGIVASREAGLIPQGSAAVYAESLTPAQLASLTGAGHRWILTDSNRRTDVAPATLTNGTSVLLPRDAPASNTRALGTALDQSAAIYTDGVSSVTASSYWLDGHGVVGAPIGAVDGKPDTAWLTGVFGTAQGQTLTIRFDKPRKLGFVGITTSNQPDRRIARIRLTFGSANRSLAIDDAGKTFTELGDVVGQTLTLELQNVVGAGAGPVGISDINWGWTSIHTGASLPLTLDNSVAEGHIGQEVLATTPVDVVMSRSRAQEWFGSEEETQLLRRFTLPSPKAYRGYGVAEVPETAKAAPTIDSEGCLSLMTIDGAPVRARPLGGTPKVGKRFLFNTCTPLLLKRGAHKLESDPALLLETVVLRDVIGDSVPAVSQVPTVTVTEQSPTHLRVAVSNPQGTPLWVSTGTSLDSGWRATSDAETLGAPIVLDGYSMSWLVTKPGESTIDITFAPQRAANVALAASLVALLGCILLALFARRRTYTVDRLERWRPTHVQLAVAVVVWGALSQGVLGAAVCLILGLLVASRIVGSRIWFMLGVGAVALAPFAWVLGNYSRFGNTTSDLVLLNPLPGYLCWLGLTAVAIGVALPHTHKEYEAAISLHSDKPE